MRGRMIHGRGVSARAAGVLLLLACGCAHATAVSPCTEEFDEAAVIAVLQTQRAAWNSGDLDGFLAGYEQSEALLFTSGAKIRRGFAETRDKYRARYGEARETMGALEFEILDVRALGQCSDAAVVLGRWAVSESANTGSGVFSVILERHDGSADEVLALVATHSTDRVAAPLAVGLDAKQRTPVGAAQVAARKPAQRPTHRIVGLAEVQEVLLGLVGLAPDRLGEGPRLDALALVNRLEGDQALQPMQATARAPPLVDARPRQRMLQGLGRAPAVGIAKPRDDASRRVEAERLDQLLAQQPERDGVEQHRSLTRES